MNTVFKTKVIYFDFVISAFCECIRNFFEKKEFDAQDILWHTKIFDSEKDFGNFINELKDLINENTKFFKKLYVHSIKEIGSASSFKPGIDSPNDVVNLGRLGNSLNPFGSAIIDLVLKHIVKTSDFFIINGIYFATKKNFFKQLDNECSKMILLQTFSNRKKVISYKYNKKKISSINDVVTKLKEDLLSNKQE